jgi:hypothetical protein
MNKQIWIGFAEVRPLPECKLLEEAKGAYVHIMAWAETAEEFQKMASLRAADLSLKIVQFRDTQPWMIRNSAEELREEFFEMETRISSDVRGVAFGRFHAWLTEQPVAHH